MAQVDQKNVWKIVKQIRKSFLSQNTEPECIYGTTLLSESLLSDSYMKDNIDVVEEKLKLKIEITQNKNVSVETLQFAASIFTYLNFCPTKDFYVLSVIKSESAKKYFVKSGNYDEEFKKCWQKKFH